MLATAQSVFSISPANSAESASPRLILRDGGTGSQSDAAHSTLAMRANGTPFAILYEARAIPDSAKPPGKPGPRSNGTKAAKTALILVTNAYSDVGRNCPTQADRTSVITGKRITARHQ